MPGKVEAGVQQGLSHGQRCGAWQKSFDTEHSVFNILLLCFRLHMKWVVTSRCFLSSEPDSQ